MNQENDSSESNSGTSASSGEANANSDIQESIELDSTKEMSLEDIDQMLATQDPEFVASLKEISADKNLHAVEIEIEDQRRIHTRVREFLWKWGVRATNATEDFAILLYKTGYAQLRRAAIYIKDLFVQSRDSIGQVLVAYSKLTKGLKLFFVGVTLGSIGVGVGLYFAFKTRWFFHSKELFLTNYADRADQKFSYADSDPMEPYYDNVRSTPNILLIEKSIVNIRPSTSSGTNPMVAFELFIEGFNPEVVAEIKQREGFFRDLIHRTTSKFSYDELEHPEGKKEYLGVLQKEVNSVVQRGQVKAIRLKTIVLKP